MAASRITKRYLIGECALYEKLLRSPQGTYPGDLASYRPGQTNNPEADASGWFVYYGQLRAAHALKESTPEGSVATKKDADQSGIDALSEAPLTRLSRIRGPGGAPRQLTVYPKSFMTLAHLHGRDMALSRLQPTVQRLYELPEFRPDIARRVLDAVADEQLRAAWIVTTPGSGMPFEAEGDAPELPPEVKSLHILEVHQILAMNIEVNYRSLLLARPLLTPDPDATSGELYWSPFFAKASEITGFSSRVLMRDWSLLAVLMQMQLLGSANREAMAKAEQERAERSD